MQIILSNAFFNNSKSRKMINYKNYKPYIKEKKKNSKLLYSHNKRVQKT